MWRYVFMAVSLISAATYMPSLLQETVDTAQESSQAEPELRAASAEMEEPSRNPLAGRKTTISPDRRGHYLAKAKLNGRSMEVLVDTGATLVAINESTARRIGIRLKPSDFKHKVRTANGVTRAATAMIDEIAIGRVVVRDVRATVSHDEALSTVLLGMSFLNRLKKFEIASGADAVELLSRFFPELPAVRRSPNGSQREGVCAPFQR